MIVDTTMNEPTIAVRAASAAVMVSTPDLAGAPCRLGSAATKGSATSAATAANCAAASAPVGPINVTPQITITASSFSPIGGYIPGLFTPHVIHGRELVDGGLLAPLPIAATRMSDAHRLIAECPCERGCPSCVQSPKCGNLNEPLEKAGALEVMARMLER